MPQRILFDNAKVVVSERVGRTIRFQTDLLDFATRLGFQPEACWVHDPETKSKVESTVGYVHRDFNYRYSVWDVATLNRDVRQWCDTVIDAVHTTTQEVPWTRWQAVEQKMLRPLPTQRPRIFRVKTVHVLKDALFTFRQNRYSVPKERARHWIRLEIGARTFVDLAGDERLGEWPRTSERGQLFLDPAHYAGRFQGDKRSTLEHPFRTLCRHAEVY